jgi:short-subunit dehydrogenase
MDIAGRTVIVTGASSGIGEAFSRLAARAEWAADGIAVSTVFPGIVATEFHQSLRAGRFRGGGIEPRPPELVAEAILLAIATGEAEITPGSPPGGAGS